jgi:hypothetical protein
MASRRCRFAQVLLTGALDVGEWARCRDAITRRSRVGVLPLALNATDPQCRNAVMRLESWKIPCAGSDNARETEFGDGGRARTLPRPRLQWGKTALPLPRIAFTSHCLYLALPLPRIAFTSHCLHLALPLPRIAFTSHCLYLALLLVTGIADHCHLSALPMPGTIQHHAGTMF